VELKNKLCVITALYLTGQGYCPVAASFKQSNEIHV